MQGAGGQAFVINHVPFDRQGPNACVALAQRDHLSELQSWLGQYAYFLRTAQ